MTAAVLAVTITLALSLASRDLWGWLPRVSRALIWIETCVLPRDLRYTRREEWEHAIDVAFDDRRLTGLAWTLRLAPVCVRERVSSWVSGRARRDGSAAPALPTMLRLSELTSAAVFAMGATLWTHDEMHAPTAWAAICGFCFCLIVAIMDRSLALASSGRSRAARLVVAVPRLLVVALASFVVATPFVLRIFGPEIAAQVARDQRRATAELTARIWKDADRELSTLNEHIQALRHQEAKRAGTKSQIRRLELQVGFRLDQRAIDLAHARFFRRQPSGLMAHLDALQHLRAQNASANTMFLSLVALLLLLGILPIIESALVPGSRPAHL